MEFYTIVSILTKSFIMLSSWRSRPVVYTIDSHKIKPVHSISNKHWVNVLRKSVWSRLGWAIYKFINGFPGRN